MQELELFLPPIPGNKSGGGSRYLKLQANEPVMVLFRGKPNHFFQVYSGGEYRPAVEGEEGASHRVAINVVLKTEDGLTRHEYNGPMLVYERLRDLSDLGVNVKETWMRLVKVKKNGKYSYTLDHAPSGSLSESDRDKVLGFDLYEDLKGDPLDPHLTVEDAANNESDVPY